MANNISATDIVATSTITKKVHVVIQNKEEKTYPYEIKGHTGTYTRMLIAFGDLDSATMFGSQLFFLLNPKKDTAYSALYKAKQADRGVITVEVTTAIVRTGKAENGEETYKSETTATVSDFEKEKKA